VKNLHTPLFHQALLSRKIFLICFEVAGISQILNASFSMHKPMHKRDYQKD
jgi:hypothetical protein